MPRIVWTEVSESGLGIKIGPRQQKLGRRPTVQLMGNPAVVVQNHSQDRSYTSDKAEVSLVVFDTTNPHYHTERLQKR